MNCTKDSVNHLKKLFIRHIYLDAKKKINKQILFCRNISLNRNKKDRTILSIQSNETILKIILHSVSRFHKFLPRKGISIDGHTPEVAGKISNVQSGVESFDISEQTSQMSRHFTRPTSSKCLQHPRCSNSLIANYDRLR